MNSENKTEAVLTHRFCFVFGYSPYLGVGLFMVGK
jgi:hypothetical protein